MITFDVRSWLLQVVVGKILHFQKPLKRFDYNIPSEANVAVFTRVTKSVCMGMGKVFSFESVY